MIDTNKITAEFSKLPVEADDNGLMPAFGVYLTKIMGDYYSAISFEFEELFLKEIDDPKVIMAAQQLLIESGHVCGFNTFGGIMKSDAWKAIVLPDIKEQVDWVKGMIAAINVLGWGIYTLEQVSAAKLIFSVKNAYESDYYIRAFGATAKTSKCYLALGAGISLMSLVFHADISKFPELDESLYTKLFLQHKMFSGEEVSCVAKGDNTCRFIINKIH